MRELQAQTVQFSERVVKLQTLVQVRGLPVASFTCTPPLLVSGCVYV